MTDSLTSGYNATGSEQRISPLIRGIFGCMSAESSVLELVQTLGSNSRPHVELIQDGAQLAFQNYDGKDDLVLKISHKRNMLAIEVRTPPGLLDRKAIASAIRRILENTLNREISFKDIERDIGKNTSSTDNSPIRYSGQFRVPAELEENLLARAQAVFDRDAESQICLKSIIDTILTKGGGTADTPKPL